MGLRRDVLAELHKVDEWVLFGCGAVEEIIRCEREGWEWRCIIDGLMAIPE
jgi:hypothetical protein